VDQRFQPTTAKIDQVLDYMKEASAGRNQSHLRKLKKGMTKLREIEACALFPNEDWTKIVDTQGEKY
jgi:hypothetical protein